MAVLAWSPTRLVLLWVFAGLAGGLTEPLIAALVPLMPHETIDAVGSWVRLSIGLGLLLVTVRWYRGWKLVAKDRVSQALSRRGLP